MRNKLLLPLLLLLLTAVACEEKERAFPEFGDDDVQTGAFARQLGGVEGIFDFFDIENSAITVNVEFYDVNRGRDVSEYNWTAIYRNKVTGENSEPVQVASISASEFTTTDSGLPGASVTFDLSDILDQIGIDQDDVNGGDDIRLESTIVTNSGQVFTRNNTGANVIGGASFRALFILDQTIVCPSDFGGTYAYTTEVTAEWPDGCAAGTTASGEVTLTETAEGLYQIDDFSFGGYGACYGSGDPGGTLRLQDACKSVSVTGVDSFGDGYTLSDLVIDGNELTFTWRSDYGEVGRTTLTSPNGWPDLVLAE